MFLVTWNVTPVRLLRPALLTREAARRELLPGRVDREGLALGVRRLGSARNRSGDDVVGGARRRIRIRIAGGSPDGPRGGGAYRDLIVVVRCHVRREGADIAQIGRRDGVGRP